VPLYNPLKTKGRSKKLKTEKTRTAEEEKTYSLRRKQKRIEKI